MQDSQKLLRGECFETLLLRCVRYLTDTTDKTIFERLVLKVFLHILEMQNLNK